MKELQPAGDLEQGGTAVGAAMRAGGKGGDRDGAVQPAQRQPEAAEAGTRLERPVQRRLRPRTSAQEWLATFSSLVG
jgi:hypothetical protein